MLGRYGGLFQVLYRVLPGASTFRGPAKMACVVAFAGAALSAYLIDVVSRPCRTLRAWSLFVPAAAGLCLVLLLSTPARHLPVSLREPDRLSWAQNDTLFEVAVAATCAVAIVCALRLAKRWMRIVSLGVIPFVCFADFSHAYGSFQHGNVNPDEVFASTDPLLLMLQRYREQFGPIRFGQFVGNKITENLYTARNDAFFFDCLEVSEGYTSFYLDSIAKFRSISNVFAKIDIQNIKAVMEVDPTGALYLGTRSTAFLRPTFFSRVRCFDSREALLDALDRGEIDWHKEVAVSDPLRSTLPQGAEQAPGTNADDEVRFESITPESYSVAYNVKRPGVILISQAFYPGWVTDDQRIRLIEVFGAFQGLVIPEPGRGRVRVDFSPPALKWGGAITLLGMIVCTVLVFGKRQGTG
jgi:hypothetical protein